MQSRPDHGASMAADEFSRDPSGLPEAGRPELLELAGGDTPAAARRPGGQAEHRTPDRTYRLATVMVSEERGSQMTTR